MVAFFDDVNSKPIFGDALEKACRYIRRKYKDGRYMLLITALHPCGYVLTRALSSLLITYF